MLDFGVAKMKMAGEPDSLPEPPAPGAAEPEALRALAGEMETVVMDVGTQPLRMQFPVQASEAETIAMTSFPSSRASDSFGSDGGRTMPGSLVGTPAYMSPEQALGRAVDFRSDTYSLAVVAYDLVCGELPFTGTTTAELVSFHTSGNPRPPASIEKVPRDVSDVVLAGLSRDPDARPSSAITFARRFHNAVDSEFFALRRSRAFLLQHLGAFAFLMLPIYTVLLCAVALLAFLFGKLLLVPLLRTVLVALAAAVALVFCDNLLRATAALIAIDSRIRVRRFVSLRVFWRLVKAMPGLAAIQARSIFLFGSGWVTRDCLWPVLCVVENLRGKEAVLRSRRLMTGLNSAGRALAIRHFALAALAAGDVIASLAIRGPQGHASPTTDAVWFPLFAIFAAAPLYLYDRTAAPEEGPLLQLNRTPEIRVTARPLSVSSMVWLAIVAIYLLYQPVKLWLSHGW
ncbi:MAG TPA: protein kinase [Bryobacteraceae bacterium]|nr:protein kinase [Bryobacteraceae bacterium]